MDVLKVAETREIGNTDYYRVRKEDGAVIQEGQRYRVEHDGFEGWCIGFYTRTDGEQGAVLQSVWPGTKVVHVYRLQWLKPAPVPVNVEQED